MSGTVLEAVRELLPAVRERAADTERMRRIPDSTVKELVDTGLFRLLQPARWGGLEGDPVEFFTAVRELASACGSTGWFAGVVGIHPWHVALFADEAQRAVWGEDPDARISSSYAPTGRAVPVPGGFRLEGTWSFSSGADHCSWVLLGGLVTDEAGGVTDFRTFLLPRADYDVVDTWDVVGLRGTGSNDVVVRDAFVPAAMTLSLGDTGRCWGPGQELNTADLYKLPFHSLFTTTITTPLVGMASGAYDEHVRLQRGRTRAAYLGEETRLDPFAAVRVARAASDVDAAWALLVANLREEQEHVARGERIPLRLRLKVRRDQVVGTQRAIEAVDALFEASGGRALATGSALQRAWRDAHAARAHAANDPERALQLFGAHEFGIKVDPGMY